MEVTIRTLDSQSHQFELSDEDLTVKEFKEIILPKVNIPVDKQRLIFRGKVLHDDKKLKEYGVDGCVVHLVERAPPSSSHNRSHPNVASQQSSNQNAGISNVNVGGLNATAANLNGVAQHLVDSLVSQFGAGNVSASQRGNSLNVNINVHEQNSERSDILRRMSTARRFLSHAEHLLRHVIQPTQPAPNHCTCNVVQHNSESTDRREHNEQSSTNNQNTAQEDSNTTENSDPDPDTSPQALSLEFSRVMHLYHHMESSLRRYTVLLDDPQTSDRSPNEDLLPDQIAEIFHDLSHAFHALSDLSFNFNSPSPQSLMCFPQMSPVRFPPPMPHVHMSTSTANRVTGAHASSTSVRTAPTGQPVNVTPSGQAIRQRTPVAVAAISTVVHIPAGSLSHLVRNAPQTSMSTLTSSSSQSAASTTTGSNTGTTFVSDHPMQNIFPPFFGNSPFPPSMAGNSTIQMGVIAGNDGASQTFNIPNVMASSQDEGSLPLGLQSIMQNIMQNMTGGAAQTVSTANTGTAVSTSATFTSSTANTIHHQTSHNTANHPSVPQTAGHPTALPCQQSHRPHPHHHHHNQDGSVVHPDMLLPCHSFHFGPTFFHGSQAPGGVQPRVVAEVSSIVIDHNGRPIATSNNAASSNSTTQAATSNPTTAGVPDMNAIPNILSGVFGNIPGNQTSQMENRVPSSDDDDTMEVDGIGSQEILRGVQQMFHTFMGGTQQTPANANPVDERETLRDFVRQNFGLTESEEEDVVTDFIDMLADNLTMQDLLGIFFGTSTDAWTRIHTPLRQLIEKHFNDNAQMSENNTKVISSRIAEYIGDTYMQVEPHITVRPEVDLSSTLRSLDICHFEKLLKLLLDDETNFARNLRDWYIEYTALSFAVLDYSVTGGADRFISSLVDTPSFQNVFQGMSPSLRQVTLQTMCSRIRAATVSRHITSTELNSVLIKPGAKTSPRENPCKGTDDVRAAKRTKKDDDNVDVSVVWEENNPGFEVTDGSGPDSPSSPEDWHSRVPSDWLVIINRDTERQRVMQPQRPYSDAYLSGLPPKRRKMMTRHAAEADRIEVGECVKTAIERADVERNHDADKLKKDIKNEDLQTMFETTFRHDIRRRLQEDEDYRPKQHPNTEEYFMKGKK